MNKIHENAKKVDTNPIYEFEVNASKVRLSLGNSKIGRMINWSTLPGSGVQKLIAKGRIITDVPGTCSEKCSECFKSCYARRSITQHHNSVTRAWAENTLMIRHRTDECFRSIDSQIRTINKKFFATQNPEDISFSLFRINVSGELNSVEELERWNDLAKKHPYMQFGVYSKNAPVLLTFFKRHGQSAPNLTVNVSQWHHVMDSTIEELHRLGAVFNIFTYDDSNRGGNTLSAEDKKYLEGLPHCKAVLKDGGHYMKPDGTPLHCEECRRCYTKTSKEIAVYSH